MTRDDPLKQDKHVLAVKAENIKDDGSVCLGDGGNALVIKRRKQYVQLGHFLAPTGAQGARVLDLNVAYGSRGDFKGHSKKKALQGELSGDFKLDFERDFKENLNLSARGTL